MGAGRCRRRGSQLPTDADATFDKRTRARTVPTSSRTSRWGTNPGQVIPVAGQDTRSRRASPKPTRRDAAGASPRVHGAHSRHPNERDVTVDTVFIGSCTNSRIEDLRAAAEPSPRVAQGQRRHAHARSSPARCEVKEQAESPKGLDQVFLAAGFDWREPGCSMCLAMNPDKLSRRGAFSASTSATATSRDAKGRGGRTHLVSPAVAAATAIAGHIRNHPADLD